MYHHLDTFKHSAVVLTICILCSYHHFRTELFILQCFMWIAVFVTGPFSYLQRLSTHGQLLFFFIKTEYIQFYTQGTYCINVHLYLEYTVHIVSMNTNVETLLKKQFPTFEYMSRKTVSQTGNVKVLWEFNIIPREAVPIYSLTSGTQGFRFLYLLTNMWYFCFPELGCSFCWIQNVISFLLVVFFILTFISLGITDIRQISTCLLGHLDVFSDLF